MKNVSKIVPNKVITIAYLQIQMLKIILIINFFLIENSCFEDGIKPYPGECTRYLNCANNITHVLQCGAGFCFTTTCITTGCDSICNT